MTAKIDELMNLKAQIKLLKIIGAPLLGASWVLIMALGGWVYTQGIKGSELKKEIAFQGKTIERNEGWLKATSQRVGDMSGDLKAIQRDIKYMREGVSEIKEMLKKK